MLQQITNSKKVECKIVQIQGNCEITAIQIQPQHNKRTRRQYSKILFVRGGNMSQSFPLVYCFIVSKSSAMSLSYLRLIKRLIL